MLGSFSRAALLGATTSPHLRFPRQPSRIGKQPHPPTPSPGPHYFEPDHCPRGRRGWRRGGRGGDTWPSYGWDLCACALQFAQGPVFKETGATTIVVECGLWSPGLRPALCAEAGKAGEQRRSGAGQWGGKQPRTRRGRGASALGSSPARGARGTPSVTWWPPGSPCGLAGGSAGPPRIRAREGAFAGAALDPARSAHWSLSLPAASRSPSPSCVLDSRAARTEGHASPLLPGRPRDPYLASSPCPLSRTHRRKALQEKRLQGLSLPNPVQLTGPWRPGLRSGLSDFFLDSF